MTSAKNDFLLEIGCAELPVHAQQTLSAALQIQFSDVLSENKLSFDHIKIFSTPRRLAVFVGGLQTQQSPQTLERQGPALSDAYDKNGTPTLVCLGFAKSCGVSVDQLIQKETQKGIRLVHVSEKPGSATKNILPNLVQKVITRLPLSKSMRWGMRTALFIRPVHWVVMLFGDECIETELFELTTSQETIGHRFHHPKPIMISKASDYLSLLYTQGFVIADAQSRKNRIRKEIQTLLIGDQKAVINEALLNEVTGLVEWPVVLKGQFDPVFLSIPKECLMTAMQKHQKCFPVVNTENQPQSFFIVVSNIASKKPATVVAGNERVIHARLSDAAFFYQQDCKKSLDTQLEKLNHIVFQDQLGSMGDKVKRLETLSVFLAKKLNSEIPTVKRAAQLSKCDLTTEMVMEFPDLQGVMGYYYTHHHGESELVSIAIRDHYYPKFSGDILPSTIPGCCIAIADRVDTIVGTLGMEKFPTGDKDPFALRRAAQGILRICIEKECDFGLQIFLTESKKTYGSTLKNHNVVCDTVEFIMMRLKSWYGEKNIAPQIVDAVMVKKPTSLLDFDRRLKAVVRFQTLPEASSLSATNKRVNNILKKQTMSENYEIHSDLPELPEERELAKKVHERSSVVNALYNDSNYEKALLELSALKEPVDRFFDSVMIMTDDKKKKQNRLALLFSVRQLFTRVADISLL